MNKQASRFVGSIPGFYDEHLGPRIFVDYATDLAHRVAGLNPRAVLELAAGTGIVTRKLRDALASDCELLASDLNAAMLDVAREKFAPGESVRFEVVDANELQFGDSNFDTVTCQFGVMFFPDKARSYSEVFRVLEPGGSYVFNVWDSWEENPFAEIVHETVAEIFPDDPPGFYKVPFSYHDPDEIRNSVLAAGFESVDVEHLPVTSAVGSPADFATGLVFGNPLIEEINAIGGDPHAVRDKLAEVIAKELGDEMRLQALVVHASKS